MTVAQPFLSRLRGGLKSRPASTMPNGSPQFGHGFFSRRASQIAGSSLQVNRQAMQTQWLLYGFIAYLHMPRD